MYRAYLLTLQILSMKKHCDCGQSPLRGDPLSKDPEARGGTRRLDRCAVASRVPPLCVPDSTCADRRSLGDGSTRLLRSSDLYRMTDGLGVLCFIDNWFRFFCQVSTPAYLQAKSSGSLASNPFNRNPFWNWAVENAGKNAIAPIGNADRAIQFLQRVADDLLMLHCGRARGICSLLTVKRRLCSTWKKELENDVQIFILGLHSQGKAHQECLRCCIDLIFWDGDVGIYRGDIDHKSSVLLQHLGQEGMLPVDPRLIGEMFYMRSVVSSTAFFGGD